MVPKMSSIRQRSWKTDISRLIPSAQSAHLTLDLCIRGTNVSETAGKKTHLISIETPVSVSN